MRGANAAELLGIDCGTQGTKAIILDAASGEVLGEGAAQHTLITAANGRREQDTAQWIDAFKSATRQALAAANVDGRTIQGVGVSGQQHGLVLLDDQGQVLRPAKLWCDTETTPENDRLLAYLGGEQGSLERLGVVIAPGYTVSKLLWTKQHHPDVFARIAHILLPHDYLNYWLTGRACSEYGDASGTGYFNVRTRQWDVELLRDIDPDGRLEAALPELIEAHQPVGPLLPQIAEQLGLNPWALVSSGGGDNMMAAIGTGCVEEGRLAMSLGTSGTLFAWSASPKVDPQGRWAAFCASDGGWLPLICTMNCTVVTEQVADAFGFSTRYGDGHLRATSPGADGLVMLPFLNGERTPDLPLGKGVLAGLDTTNMTPAHVYRAAMEGATYSLKYGFDAFVRAGMRFERIVLTGGGSNSAAWRQLVADVFGLPVHRDCAGADVLLVTDGEIWQAEEMTAAARASGHRVFAIGVGSSPAEGVLRSLAEGAGEEIGGADVDRAEHRDEAQKVEPSGKPAPEAASEDRGPVVKPTRCWEGRGDLRHGKREHPRDDAAGDPTKTRPRSAHGRDCLGEGVDAAGEDADDREGNRKIGEHPHSARQLLGVTHAVQRLDVVVMGGGFGLACWIHHMCPCRFDS